MRDMKRKALADGMRSCQIPRWMRLSYNANASWPERDEAHYLHIMLCYVCCTKLQNLIPELLVWKNKPLTHAYWSLSPIPQIAPLFPYDLSPHIAFDARWSIGALARRLCRYPWFAPNNSQVLVSYFDIYQLFLNFQHWPILTFPTITLCAFNFNVHE